MENEICNPLASAVRLTQTLPAGRSKLILLCKCAKRQREDGKHEEAKKLFHAAHMLLEDIPVDHGRKYMIHQLVLTSAEVSELDKGRELAAELEKLFDYEKPTPFREMTAGLVIQAWVTLDCLSKTTRFLSNLPSESRAKCAEAAVLTAASVGRWKEALELLENSDLGGRLAEVAAEVLIRLSGSDLPASERQSAAAKILKVAGLADKAV